MHKVCAIQVLSALLMLNACTADDDGNDDVEGTLDAVWQRGALACGINGSQRGFSYEDADGVMQGLDADYCRAIAAAIGVPEIEFVPLTAEERLDAVRDGRVDVLSRTTTWTFSRDINGLEFVGTIFYDGEGFLVKNIDGVTSIADFPAPNFCILTGTTSRANLGSYFQGEVVDISEYATEDERITAFLADECNVYTYDRSALLGVKLDLPNPDDFVILDDVISKEPLGPVVRDDDPQWADIARWTFFAMLNAEEMGIDSTNADDLRDSSEDVEIQRFLGVVDQDLATLLGLGPDWAYQIVREVGNYGEVFARNVGAESELGLPRGLNALWLDGGLMYAPPIK